MQRGHPQPPDPAVHKTGSPWLGLPRAAVFPHQHPLSQQGCLRIKRERLFRDPLHPSLVLTLSYLFVICDTEVLSAQVPSALWESGGASHGQALVSSILSLLGHSPKPTEGFKQGGLTP